MHVEQTENEIFVEDMKFQWIVTIQVKVERRKAVTLNMLFKV
jgi:hypothetical protein